MSLDKIFEILQNLRQRSLKVLAFTQSTSLGYRYEEVVFMNEGISHHNKINGKLLQLFGVGSRSWVLTDSGRFRI